MEYSITLNYKIEAKNNLTGEIKSIQKKLLEQKTISLQIFILIQLIMRKKIIENMSDLDCQRKVNEIILVLQNDI